MEEAFWSAYTQERTFGNNCHGCAFYVPEEDECMVLLETEIPPCITDEGSFIWVSK